VSKLMDYDHQADKDDKSDGRNKKFMHISAVFPSIKH
jgi:hypothetical protein